MTRVVDLRSDTVTKPTPEMRRAMAEAEVGDDVYGEDPTVNRLQELAAEMLGKEAALFVPSGTMGNEIAVRVHTRPGTEVILDSRSHIFLYELAGTAVLSQVQTRPIDSVGGLMPPEAVEAAVRTADDHEPGTSLLCVENTHNLAGGTVLPPETMRAYRRICDRHGISMHLDGARIFNAAVALGVPAAELVRDADSVMFCLSKGLCAPVGSILCGGREFIREAHRVRKLFGGGMRQAGVLAAAGIAALTQMVDRLAEDHEKARRLAEALADTPGLAVDLASVQTNMVYAEVTAAGVSGKQAEQALKQEGVLCLSLGPTRLRFVTHHDVSLDDIDCAVAAVRRAFAQWA
ncbi:MAG: low-specificity L-threonine aldolase [Armatimonadota bacterium]